MSNLLTASQDVQALAAKFKGIVALGEHLAALGSLENMESEIKARIEKVKGDEKTAQDDYANVLKMTKEAHDTLAGIQENMLLEVEGAQKKETEILAQARIDADKIVEDAKANAQAIAEHAAKVKQESVDSEAQIAAKKAEYEQLEGKIATAKAKLAKFLKE